MVAARERTVIHHAACICTPTYLGCPVLWAGCTGAIEVPLLKACPGWRPPSAAGNHPIPEGSFSGLWSESLWEALQALLKAWSFRYDSGITICDMVSGMNAMLKQYWCWLFTLENPVKMLQVQYRMLPEICQFPSDHFYHSKLKPSRYVRWSVRVYITNEFPTSWLCTTSCVYVTFCLLMACVQCTSVCSFPQRYFTT